MPDGPHIEVRNFDQNSVQGCRDAILTGAQLGFQECSISGLVVQEKKLNNKRRRQCES